MADGFYKGKPYRFCYYLEYHVIFLLSPYCKKFSCPNCIASDFQARLFALGHWQISQSFFISSVRYLAEWMVNGYPSENVWPLDLKRFGTLQSSRTFLRHRVMEVMRKWALCILCWPGCSRFLCLLFATLSLLCHHSENHFPSSWPPLGQYSLSYIGWKGIGAIWRSFNDQKRLNCQYLRR